MDPTAFDTLARAFATGGTRRGVLRRLVASLPLVGVLAAGGRRRRRSRAAPRAAGSAHPAAQPPAAQPPAAQQAPDQHNKNTRTQHRHQHDNNHNGGGGGGGGNPGPCTPNGQACQRNSDCCGGNCFNQQCAATVPRTC